MYIIHHIVFSNLVIAFGSVGLLGTGFILIGKELNVYALAFTFCSTLLMYNLQRIHKLRYQTLDKANVRHQWIMKNQRSIQFLIVVCALILAMLIPFFHWKEIIGLAFLGLISFFYSYKTGLGNLRSLPGMKIVWIASVWAFTVSVFTVGQWVSEKDIWLFLYSFTFIVAITIPFDIRDIDYDSKSFRTIPQLIGEVPSRILGFFLIWVSYFLVVLILEEYSIFLSLVYGIFSIIVWGSTSDRQELYFSGIMDFTLILAFLSHFLYDSVSFFHF